VNLRARSTDSAKESESEAKMETSATATSRETHAAIAPKICARPGCTTELGPFNKSGKCASHFHWREPAPAKERSTAGNGHAAARSNGSNGHAVTTGDAVAPKATNGSNGANGRRKSIEATPDLAGAFVEDRVDRLILSLPAVDKVKIATAWLQGKL
jgi:hypothetical protein